jgi:hypothetical protein
MSAVTFALLAYATWGPLLMSGALFMTLMGMVIVGLMIAAMVRSQ